MPADPTPHGASASGAGASGDDASGAGASGSAGAGASRVGGSDTGYHPERTGGWTSGDAPQRLAQIALRDLPWEVGVAKRTRLSSSTRSRHLRWPDRGLGGPPRGASGGIPG